MQGCHEHEFYAVGDMHIRLTISDVESLLSLHFDAPKIDAHHLRYRDIQAQHRHRKHKQWPVAASPTFYRGVLAEVKRLVSDAEVLVSALGVFCAINDTGQCFNHKDAEGVGAQRHHRLVDFVS